MLKTKFIAVLAFAVFTIAPVYVLAGDGSERSSYSLKKQGRTHFQSKTQDNSAAVQDATAKAHPADIEPAAGAFTPEEDKQKTLLEQRMKLPRKN